MYISHSYNYMELQKTTGSTCNINITDLGFDVERNCLCQYHRYLLEIKKS